MILFSKAPKDYKDLPAEYDPDDVWFTIGIVGIVLTVSVIIVGLV